MRADGAAAPTICGSPAEEDGDRLTLHYEEYSPATGEPYEGSACLLTVRLLEDGSFRYLGNHKA